MEEKLFASFKSVSDKEWREKIEVDLKGKPFESLFWEIQGLSGPPIYTREKLEEIPSPEIHQNLAREANKHLHGNRHWVNYELIQVQNEKEANKAALHALNMGAEGLLFQFEQASLHMPTLLKEVLPQYCHLSFSTKTTQNEVLTQYETYIKGLNVDRNSIHGFYEGPANSGHMEAYPNFRTHLLKSVGGDAIQSLATLLSKTVDFITRQDQNPAQIVGRLQFELTVRNSHFIEISKLRAFRVLLSTLFLAYDLEISPSSFRILTRSESWNEDTKDEHNYLLRGTTQAMAGIIGGCNDLLILPFDSTFPENPTLAKRNARNISSILKEESYLNKVIDASAGSYYIESLTRELIDTSWKLFQAIEKKGGIGQVSPTDLQNLQEKSN